MDCRDIECTHDESRRKLQTGCSLRSLAVHTLSALATGSDCPAATQRTAPIGGGTSSNISTSPLKTGLRPEQRQATREYDSGGGVLAGASKRLAEASYESKLIPWSIAAAYIASRLGI